jgi:hypothetical protein
MLRRSCQFRVFDSVNAPAIVKAIVDIVVVTDVAENRAEDAAVAEAVARLMAAAEVLITLGFGLSSLLLVQVWV